MINTFHKDTPQQVKDVLKLFNESFRSDRLRIWYGDTATGEAWCEEHNVIGYIGNSTGESKIPLLINNSRSMGGDALLDHCIVAIKDTTGRWRYKHPTFTVGEWYYEANASILELSFVVYHNGAIQSHHKTLDKAKHYIAFMKGDRYCK